MDKIERMRRFLENTFVEYKAGRMSGEDMLVYSRLMDSLINTYYRKRSCAAEQRFLCCKLRYIPRGNKRRYRKRA